MQQYPLARDLMEAIEHCSACAATNPETDDGGDSACCGARVCHPDGTAQDACCAAVQERMEAEASQPPASAVPAARTSRRRKKSTPRETRGLQAVNGHANVVSRTGGSAPKPDDTKEPTMTAHTATAATAPGTRVRITTPVNGTPDVTGVTRGTPALTPSGHVVSVDYDAAFAHLSPAGGHDHDVTELEVIPAEATPAQAPAPAAARTGRARRAALGEAAVSGWELLYDKPKQNAQVGRRFSEGKPQYALICTVHQHVHALSRLTQERTVRTNGGWCPDCSK